MVNGFPMLSPPTKCEYCGEPFKLSETGSHYKAWRLGTGELVCNEWCAEGFADQPPKRRRVS